MIMPLLTLLLMPHPHPFFKTVKINIPLTYIVYLPPDPKKLKPKAYGVYASTVTVLRGTHWVP